MCSKMIKSLQIIDTLRIGGAERMAINIANSLSCNYIESHLCVTREEGELKKALKENVYYVFLGRKSTFDLNAILKLKRYVKNNNIDILHAHGTSFFMASLIKILISKVKLVWHDHHGARAKNTGKLKLLVLKFCSLYFNLVYAVNNDIKYWILKNLFCQKVKFITNYPTSISEKETSLKGEKGKRILCLANLREPKNHKLLFEAFKRINKNYKDWTLHCVGTIFNDNYSKELKVFITENDLENHIFLYNAKEDVSHIISQVDIGILTSSSEGLPMSLLEYGLGGLPVITTDVGYCSNLILDKSHGVLTPSDDVDAITNGIMTYITNVDYRNTCSVKFQKRVIEDFSESNVISTIVKDYALLHI